jgi:hypothetical protein
MAKRDWILLSVLGLSSCMPSHLQKYRRDPGAGDEPRNLTAPSTREIRTNQPSENAKQPLVEPVDHQTFRFRVSESVAWEAALAVLVKDYNVNVVDRQSGLLTTEWDSSTAGDTPKRNKISLLIRKTSWQSVEITIYNNDEALSSSNGESVWMKAGDGRDEISRVAKNIALRLGEPASGAEVSEKATDDHGLLF